MTATGEINETISIFKKKRKYMKWIRVAIYAVLVIAGQSTATLLGRQYFDKGGKSNWLGTLVQVVGFPLLLPSYFFLAPYRYSLSFPQNTHQNVPPISLLVFIYSGLGLLVAGDCYLYTVGLNYLPVSTYSLICSSQLAFNAVFSFFLNSQKFTPYIINSLVLLTVASILLVFQTDSDSSTVDVSKTKYAIGFVCTIAASAGYGLLLSVTQFVFKRVLKTASFKAVVDMIVYQSLFASLFTLAGLFGSGEWRNLEKEMDGFKLGRVSYVMNLVGTAVSWQGFSVGIVGLVFEVSALFSNAISAVGLPVVPVLAVIFFHDKMHGIKAMAMVLSVWGFVSYGYQHYLDDLGQSAIVAQNIMAAQDSGESAQESTVLNLRKSTVEEEGTQKDHFLEDFGQSAIVVQNTIAAQASNEAAQEFSAWKSGESRVEKEDTEDI